MATTWKYKVITLKRGGLWLTQAPSDEETIAALNRKDALAWELVNGAYVGPGQLTVLYLKRPC
jgi:hypothetical protein